MQRQDHTIIEKTVTTLTCTLTVQLTSLTLRLQMARNRYSSFALSNSKMPTSTSRAHLLNNTIHVFVSSVQNPKCKTSSSITGSYVLAVYVYTQSSRLPVSSLYAKLR